MARRTTAPCLLRISEVVDRIGVGHPTIYRWVAAGEFPKQIAIGANSIVWLESGVTKWLDQHIGRDDTPKYQQDSPSPRTGP